MNVLFICNQNRNRSKTAEMLFKAPYTTRSAGLYNEKPVTEAEIGYFSHSSNCALSKSDAYSEKSVDIAKAAHEARPYTSQTPVRGLGIQGSHSPPLISQCS
ncbi:hypothetical protein HYY74_02010 [Candidatus Woesearchaeota archaeon]|nr:hypothetical protein [Candidatus Woesearchaeota archaeon]